MAKACADGDAHLPGIQDQGAASTELESADYKTIVYQLKSKSGCIDVKTIYAAIEKIFFKQKPKGYRVIPVVGRVITANKLFVAPTMGSY